MARNDIGEPFIKHDLIDKVEKVTHDCGEHDFDWKIWTHDTDVNEQRHLSELYEIFENFTQTDCAVAVVVALENFPEMVIEIIKDYIREKIVDKERKRKNENG